MLGEYLKKCREASGLSLEAISKKTRIRPNHLRELEADDFNRFPGSVYVKSYIKQYLEALSINPSEGLSIYDRMLEKSDEVTQPYADTPSSPTVSRSKIIYPIVIVVILAAVAFYFFGVRTLDDKPVAEFQSRPAETATLTPPPQEINPPEAAKPPETAKPSEAPKPTDALTPPGAGKPPEAAKNETLPILVGPPASSVQKPADVVKEPVALTAQKPELKNEPKPTQKPTPKPTDEPQRTKKYTLSIKAVQETWISARIDDKEHHSELLQPGASVVLNADEKIIVRIGNAGGVTASFNGKNLGSLGQNKEVVNLTLPKPEPKPESKPRNETGTD